MQIQYMSSINFLHSLKWCLKSNAATITLIPAKMQLQKCTFIGQAPVFVEHQTKMTMSPLNLLLQKNPWATTCKQKGCLATLWIITLVLNSGWGPRCQPEVLWLCSPGNASTLQGIAATKDFESGGGQQTGAQQHQSRWRGIATPVVVTYFRPLR